MFRLDTRQGRDEALRRMGNTYQAAGTRHYRLTEGSSDGTRVIDVRTGSGLEYSVVPDRGMDISLASYKGVNLTYLSRNGEVDPAHYEPVGEGWLRTFFGGLLTTCGVATLGPPCVDEGEALGMHGRHNATPARNVCDLSDFRGGEIKLTGSIEDCTLFGSKIVIRRSIGSKIGESVITIEDEVENIGSHESPLTLLYHVNFGYPILDENTEIFVSAKNPQAYDEYSHEHIGEVATFRKPDGGNAEKNYWYAFDANRETAWAMAVNRKLQNGLGVYIRFDAKSLPYMTQWKFEDEIDYVLALEPSNTLCLSRKDLREKGLLPVIEAHVKRTMRLEIGIVEGNDQIDEFVNNQ
jgi:hypothetical protein